MQQEQTTAVAAAAAMARQKEGPLFLRKTFALIEQCTAEFPGLAAWSAEGDSFFIKDADRLGAEVIPLYFKHSKCASFVRQLNFYGFKKVKSAVTTNAETDKWSEYAHPKFLRAYPQLMTQIERATHPTHPASSSSSSSSGSSTGSSKQEKQTNTQEVLELRSEVTGLKARLQSMTDSIAELTGLVNELVISRKAAFATAPAASGEAESDPSAAAAAAAAVATGGPQQPFLMMEQDPGTPERSLAGKKRRIALREREACQLDDDFDNDGTLTAMSAMSGDTNTTTTTTAAITAQHIHRLDPHPTPHPTTATTTTNGAFYWGGGGALPEGNVPDDGAYASATTAMAVLGETAPPTLDGAFDFDDGIVPEPLPLAEHVHSAADGIHDPTLEAVSQDILQAIAMDEQLPFEPTSPTMLTCSRSSLDNHQPRQAALGPAGALLPSVMASAESPSCTAGGSPRAVGTDPSDPKALQQYLNALPPEMQDRFLEKLAANVAGNMASTSNPSTTMMPMTPGAATPRHQRVPAASLERTGSDAFDHCG